MTTPEQDAQTKTERRVVIEGINYGRPFRESSIASDADDADRMMKHFQERINHPPESLNGLAPTILRAELRTREVTPWTTVSSVGQQRFVDAWLATERYKIHDLDDLQALRDNTSQQGDQS